MSKYPDKERLILICGWVGIIGVLLTIASDFILLGRAVNARTFFRLGTESMAGLAQWRITVGTFLGVLALPLQIAGLIPVYYGLKPAGKLTSYGFSIITAHALIIGVAFHASYAYIGSTWNVYYKSGLENPALLMILKKFNYFWKLIIFIMLGEILFASILFAFAVLKKKTLYPKWMFLVNPIFVFALMYPVILVIPAPAGGFAGPAYLNISTLMFMALSTYMVWYKGTSLKMI